MVYSMYACLFVLRPGDLVRVSTKDSSHQYVTWSMYVVSTVRLVCRYCVPEYSVALLYTHYE